MRHYSSILLLALLQVSFISALPYPVSGIILIFPLILWDIIREEPAQAQASAIVFSLLAGLFTYQQFGIMAVSLFAITLINLFLFNQFLTNASLYTVLALSLIDQCLWFLLSHGLVSLYAALKLFVLPHQWLFDWPINVAQCAYNFLILIWLARGTTRANKAWHQQVFTLWR